MQASHRNLPIAIVGMACRLPGSANLQEYWELIRSGRSAVAELPHDVLDRELYYDPNKGVLGKSYSALGGLAPRIPFRPENYPTFAGRDDIANSFDATHLSLCDVAADALRHAGKNPFQVAERNTGVYIGHAGGSRLAGDIIYSTLIEEIVQFLYELETLRPLGEDRIATVLKDIVDDIRRTTPHRDDRGGPDLAANVAAALIAKAFRLNGPYMALDAACASSLKAMMLGIRALQQGRIDMAIAGGASLCKSDSLVLFSQAQSVSATGSRPFDADADGLITAEGYVTVVMKTLPRALADGDPIHAVIRGMGISSDGKGKSLWAPRKEGQVVALHRAYDDNDFAERIQYLEAHATSTQVGDATELTALAEALGPRLPQGTRLPLGAVKANIGHTLECAGMAGLFKVVLAMQQGVIPPAINIRKLNPKIDWDNAPFFVPQQELPWPEHADGHQRRAAVNAFGIGGLNIHVVVDQFVPEKPTSVYLPSAAPRSAEEQNDISADEPIAVIGMGAILPGAHTVAAFWDLLASARDPKSDATPDRWNLDVCYRPGPLQLYYAPGKHGGFITGYEYDWRKHKVPPKQIQNGNPLQFMLLDAAEQAIQDAGYRDRPFDKRRVGVVVGTIFGGDFANRLQMGLRLPEFGKTLAAHLRRHGVPEDRIPAVYEEYCKVFLKHMPALADETGSFTSSTLASRITKSFDLMGGAFALDAGHGSALAAISSAMDILRSGDTDMMICASGQRNMDQLTFEGMAASNLLAADGVRSPFAEGSSGIVPGEGVGVVILKRLSDARRDGDKIHSIIYGVSAATNDEQPAEATRIAMQRALQATHLKPSEVAAVETSTLGDADDVAAEVEAIAEVYGSADRKQPLVLSTIVDQLGHTGGASGMVELLKASLALEHKQFPSGLGVEQPSAAIRERSDALQTLSRPISFADGEDSIVAITAGSGSGSTYHALVDRGDRVRTVKKEVALGFSSEENAKAAPSIPLTPADDTWQIVRFASSDLDGLIRQAAEAAPKAAEHFVPQSKPFQPSDALRLAIVAESTEELARKLKLAADQLKKPEARSYLEGQGVFCRERLAVPPRIAFMFPGQNSQYVGMCRELVQQFPPATRILGEIDATVSAAGYGSFADFAWADTGKLGNDNWTTQGSILLASTLIAQSLIEMGVRPDVVTGHSFGENPALVCAGAWTLEQALHTVRSRSRLLDECSIRGSMMATTAPSELAEQAVREVGGNVFVANYNAPKQTVVAGEEDRVQAVIERLSAMRQKSRLLAVPCPFHSPLMAPMVEPFRKALTQAKLSRPHVPFVSSVTNRYVADPEDIRENLAGQLTTPVRYVELVRKLAAETPTVFVEAGPQQNLTGLHPRILQGEDAWFIAADNPRRPGVGQLYCVRALLECAGALDESRRLETSVAINQPPQRMEAAMEQRKGRIVHFDATQQRKEKQHSKAAAGRTDLQSVQEARRENILPSSTQAPRSTPSANPQAAANGHPARDSGATKGQKPAPAFNREALENLEQFLIDFVVEETGYPPEIVEVDADLEGDLGIDSIKKAQLFGELAEHFPITPSADMSLDDFTTLRHVMEYIQQQLGEETANAPEASNPEEASRMRQLPDTAAAPAAPTTNTPTAEPTTDWVAAKAVPVEDAWHNKTMSNGHHVPASPNGSAASAPREVNTAALENLDEFLINFVVEETGYPPEIVELDADLEGDLGIDSIKKAQLFGELAEHFPITPSADMSLDDFTTLRHVKDFIEQALGSGSVASESVSSANSDGSEQNAASTASANPQTPHPPENDNNHDSAESASFPHPAPVNVNQEALENLDEFLINFVVEETGYPPEIVELDADLEGDLGIDSIKKAQLFGELAEHFPITPSADLSLDDFTTLRHVKDFIEQQLGLGAAPVAGDNGHAQVNTTANSGSKQASHETNGRATHGLNGHAEHGRNGHATHGTNGHVQQGANGHSGNGKPAPAASGAASAIGTPPYQQGMQYGQAHKDEIRQALRWLADTAGSAAEAGSERARLLFEPTEEELDEYQGIADGAEVAVENILAHKALLRDERLKAKLAATGIAVGTSAAATATAPVATDATTRSSRPATSAARASLPVGGRFSAAAGASSEGFLGKDAEEDAPRVMKRFVLRVTESPLPAVSGAQMQLADGAVILGMNDRAQALKQKLESLGQVVHLLPANNADEAVAALNQVWQTGPAPHLFLMNACAAPSSSPLNGPANASAAQESLVPFEVCQRWHSLVEEHGLVERATLAAVTALGGDFGFQAGATNFAGGGLAGLLKAVRRETPNLRVKILDTTDHEAPATVADVLLNELTAGTPEAEVAWQYGKRYLVQAIEQTAPATTDFEIRAGGVWVMTGGARGVTAFVAQELGKRFGLDLHLIGSSAVPQVKPEWQNLSTEQLAQLKPTILREAREAGKNALDEWKRVEKAIEMDRNLRKFEELGLKATYHQCDVTDRSSLAAVLDEIRRTAGPIEGVIHGAGVEIPTRFAKKQRENVARTIGPKVDGSLNLLALTQNDPLKVFIAFGSNSGRFGGHGQTDYSLASEMQCKIVDWLRIARPEVAACGFHWPSWDEVGMAVRPEIKVGLKRAGLSFLPPDEGVLHLLDELRAGLPESEVLILDRPHLLDVDGIIARGERVAQGGNGRLGASQTLASSATSIAGASQTLASSATGGKLALVESVQRENDGNFIVRATLDPTADPFLVSHRLHGRPFLPAVLAAELFAEAAKLVEPNKMVVGLRNIDLANGLSFYTDRKLDVQIRVGREGNLAQCELVADFYNKQGVLAEAGKRYSTGVVEFGDRVENIEHAPPGEPTFPYADFMYPPQEFTMYHGEPFRTLKGTSYQFDGGRSTLIARPPRELAGNRDGDWLLPSALVDGAMVACGTFTFAMFEGRVELPRRLERLRFSRLPREGEACTLRLFYRGDAGSGKRFDFVLFGADDDVLVAVDGYESILLDSYRV